MKKIEIEGHRCRWRFWMAPDLTPEERGQAGHAISLALIDPPRPVAELRRVAVRTALNLYDGAPSNRAKKLESRFSLYLSGAWLREKSLESLPEPHSAEKTLLHRIASLNNGRPLCARQFLRIAGPL